MAANILIYILQKWSRDQNLKNLKEFFNDILLKIDLQYWNIFFLIILFQNGSQNNFCHIAQ